MRALPAGLLVRPIASHDSYDELTEMLHRAYRELAEMGQRFHATHQDAAVTRRRAERGECFVAELEGKLVATITFYPADKTRGCPWYDRPDVASAGQLGVDPA